MVASNIVTAGIPMAKASDQQMGATAVSDALDKLKHSAEDVAGKAKEKAGDAKGDEKLEAEGKNDQTEAKVKKTGDDIKDIFKS